MFSRIPIFVNWKKKYISVDELILWFCKSVHLIMWEMYTIYVEHFYLWSTIPIGISTQLIIMKPQYLNAFLSFIKFGIDCKFWVVSVKFIHNFSGLDRILTYYIDMSCLCLKTVCWPLLSFDVVLLLLGCVSLTWTQPTSLFSYLLTLLYPNVLKQTKYCLYYAEVKSIYA